MSVTAENEILYERMSSLPLGTSPTVTSGTIYSNSTRTNTMTQQRYVPASSKQGRRLTGGGGIEFDRTFNSLTAEQKEWNKRVEQRKADKLARKITKNAG